MDESIRVLLMKSGLLDLPAFVLLHFVLRKEYNWREFWLSGSPASQGQTRFSHWKHCLQSTSLTGMPHLRSPHRRAGPDPSLSPANGQSVRDLYLSTLQGIPVEQINNFSSGQDGEILRDVVRTYQSHPLFVVENGLGRGILTRVLLVFARSVPEVGYCQGMNFVVGVLIVGRFADQGMDLDGDAASVWPKAGDISAEELLDIEISIYEVLRLIVHPQGKLRMAGLWAERIPRLKMRVYMLDRLTRWYHPALSAHFIAIDLSPELLSTQWFITLFAYILPLSVCAQVYDYLFVTGWPGVYLLAMALLGLLEAELLALADMEAVAGFMKHWKISNRTQPAATERSNQQQQGPQAMQITLPILLMKAERLVITEEVLNKLQEGYAHELLALGELRREEILLTHEHQQEAVGSSSAPSTPVPSSAPASTSPSPVPGSASTELTVHNPSYVSRVQTQQQHAPQPLKHLEKPTYWLLRYAYKLTPAIVQALHGIYMELQEMDASIDMDKGLLQGRLKKVCLLHREAEEHLSSELSLVSRFQQQLYILEKTKAMQIQHAESVYQHALAYIQGTSGAGTGRRTWYEGMVSMISPKKKDKDKEKQMTDHEYNVEKANKEEFPYLPGLNNGPIRHILYQHRLQTTKTLNENLQELVKDIVNSPSEGLPAGVDIVLDGQQADSVMSSASSSAQSDGPTLCDGIMSTQRVSIQGTAADTLSREADAQTQSTVSTTESMSSSGSLSSSTTVMVSAGTLSRHRQLKQLEQQSQEAQQKIITAHKALEECKIQLLQHRRLLEAALIQEEELSVCRKSLCDQLQLLVEDSNRGRSQKLMFVAEHFIV